MNTKTLYLSLLAAALMTGASAAEAAKAVSVADSVRLQMRNASMNIEADIRANVKAEKRHLDVPGVSVGTVRVVDSNKQQSPAARESRPVLETADAGRDAGASDLLQRDLVLKALSSPGMYGMYRYMALSAINAATIIAE